MYRSELIKKNLNPEWAPFVLSTLAVGGIDTLFTINCYDWDKDGGHDLIGTLTTTLRDLTFGPTAIALINPSKVGR
jgi:Ca2+-dependent lipid-binding protein